MVQSSPTQSPTGGVFARFLMVGVVNTVLGYGVIFGLLQLDVNVYLANLAGYCVGVAVGFVLNRRFTFRSGNRALPELGRFLIVFAISLAFAEAVVWSTLTALDIPAELASLAGMAGYTLVNFLLNRAYTFRVREVDPSL